MIVSHTLVVCGALSNMYYVQGTSREKSESANFSFQTKTNASNKVSAISDFLFKGMKFSDLSAKHLNMITSMYNKGLNPTRNKNETNNDRKPSNAYPDPNNYLKSKAKMIKRTEFVSGMMYNDSILRYGNLSDGTTTRSSIRPEYTQRNINNYTTLRFRNLSDVAPIRRKTICWPEKECFEYSDSNLKSTSHRNITKTDNSSISKSLERENNTKNDIHSFFVDYILQKNQLKNKLTR